MRGVLDPALGAQGGAGSLTDVPGLRVGHWTDTRRPTGCTAILFDPDASAGVDYDGSAPGETGVALLQPVSPVESIHGLFLSGGGQFGLGAHAGMIRYLEDQKRGFDWGGGVRVPIAPGAVIDDLALGDPTIRPDPQAAYRACEAASARPVAEGNVGAGAGATVGRMLRAQTSGGMKGGLGTASLRLGDLVIGALAVVNAAGDVLDWRTGHIVAGARQPGGRGFADTVAVIKRTIGAAGGAQRRHRRSRAAQHHAHRRRDQPGAHQGAADQGGDDGELRRRPRDQAVSHHRRRRSAVRGVDALAQARRRERDDDRRARGGGRRRRHPARRHDGDVSRGMAGRPGR